MVSSTFILVSTAFASYASAARVLIGFRTVCAAEAAAINSRGWVYWDPNHVSASSAGQLGLGKSHSNTAGLWAGFIAGNAATGGDWFCYTTAEDSKVEKVLKVWINPATEPGQDQYPYNENTIQQILTAAGARNPDRTLRMGQILGGEELLIPVGSLPGPDDQTGGRLELETYCFPNQDDMRAHMAEKGVTATSANYDVAPFIGKRFKSMDQKRDSIDEGEGEAVARPARLLRFMPRGSKDSKTPKAGGKQAATAPNNSGKPGATAPNNSGKPGATTPNNSGKPVTTTPDNSGKPGTTASGSTTDPNTLQLAKGFTITLKKDTKAKKFPALKVDACPTGLTLGKKPKTVAVKASTKKPNGSRG